MKRTVEIETVKKIAFSDLRSLCIRKGWCTGSTSDEYFTMLSITNKENLTAEDIYDIAMFVIEHSNLEYDAAAAGMDVDSKEYVEYIMFEIEDIANTFYNIKAVFVTE